MLQICIRGNLETDLQYCDYLGLLHSLCNDGSVIKGKCNSQLDMTIPSQVRGGLAG
jgi:hypothetical protein